MTHVDVVVVGAGAAGLAAARTLQENGLTALVVEAKDRVGGRAFTERDHFSIPFDHGCSWMSLTPANPFIKFADENGFQYVDRYHPTTESKTHLGDRWASSAEMKAKNVFIEQCYAEAFAAGEAGRDVPIREVIDAASRWTPHLDYWLSTVQGRGLRHCSTLDYANSGAESGSLHVFEGYGTLVAKFGEGLAIELETPVSQIDWTGADVRIHTPNGVVSCKAAIITVSTGVLQAQRIDFTPAIPGATRSAIDALPMGRLTKIAIEFDRNVYGDFREDGLCYFDEPDDSLFVVTGFADHRMAVAYVGGELSDQLNEAGDEPSVEYVMERLTKIFGQELRSRVTTTLCTQWGSDPHVGGSYAVAAPGRATARSELRAPVADRLFFAGEATSLVHYGYAHGAYLEGKAAAEKVSELLR